MNKRECLGGRMVIAEGLRHAREATGVSQARLADKIGKLELELRQLTATGNALTIAEGAALSARDCAPLLRESIAGLDRIEVQDA